MTSLNEMNLEADIGRGLASQASQLVSSNAQFAEQLKLQQQMGWGQLSGQFAGLAMKYYNPSGTTSSPTTSIPSGDPYGLRTGTTYG